MSVSAAAIIPPVQDSTVASLRRRVRQASRIAAARVWVSSSAKDQPPCEEDERQDATGVDRGKDVVEHDAEPAADMAVGPARRPRLQDVGDAEEEEAERVGEGV